MRTHALILTSMHETLVVPRGGADDAWQLPVFDAPPDAPLPAIVDEVQGRFSIRLGLPAGSLLSGEAGAVSGFVFLVGEKASSEGRWLPVREALRHDDGALWRLYTSCLLGGYEPPVRDFDVFHFGDAPELAARLVHLVLRGDKRATAGWLRAAQSRGDTIPTAGLVSIVNDGYGHPQCVIQTVEVRHLRFRDVPADLAALEEEGDRTLADWRRRHLDYWQREAATLRLSFSEDEVIFVEIFRVLTVLGRADQ